MALTQSQGQEPTQQSAGPACVGAEAQRLFLPAAAHGRPRAVQGFVITGVVSVLLLMAALSLLAAHEMALAQWLGFQSG